MAASAALSVVPARLRASHGDTDFYVLTSESACSRHFVSALVSEARRSDVPFARGEYPSISDFVAGISNCVLVGLVDQVSGAIIEAKLNNRGRTLTRLEYVESNTGNPAAIRRTALDTMQTALAVRPGDVEPPRGEAGALTAFYAWL